MLKKKLYLILATLFLISSSFAQVNVAELKWQTIVSDGIVIQISENPDPKTKLHVFKVKTKLLFPMSRIISVLVDTDRKDEWVPRHKETSYVEVIGPYERIEYTRYQAPWPFADRDFVLHIKGSYNPAAKHFMVTMDSIEDKRKKAVKGVIRAISYVTQVHLYAIDDNKNTVAEMIFMADLKGSIPTWAMDIIQKSWPKMILQNLKRQLSKNDIQIQNDFLKGLGIPQ